FSRTAESSPFCGEGPILPNPPVQQFRKRGVGLHDAEAADLHGSAVAVPKVRGSLMRKIALTFALVLSFSTLTANAQYFGRNKVQWEHFNFKVLKTEHFDIYYYAREADVVNDVGRQAERWYQRLSRVFNPSFARKPIVLYANPADFQQTTTTPELIGE